MSFIPEVKMDFIPSDDDDASEDNISTEINDFNEEKDITQEEIEEKKEDPLEESVPKPKSKREGMDVNEIFNMPNDTYVKDVKLTKKGKPRKPRPPMSEAHKEKLKAAREKAMAVRKAKAQEKNKEQEKLKAQIRRAVAPQQEYHNPFAGCY